jgi:hypothetical protein
MHTTFTIKTIQFKLLPYKNAYLIFFLLGIGLGRFQLNSYASACFPSFSSKQVAKKPQPLIIPNSTQSQSQSWWKFLEKEEEQQKVDESWSWWFWSPSWSKRKETAFISPEEEEESHFEPKSK